VVTYGGLLNLLWLFYEDLAFCRSDFYFQSLAVAGCTTEVETDGGTRCDVPFSHHIPRGQAPVSFRKHQRIHVGNVNIVIPFVAAMSPVPPLLKCKISVSLIF